MTIYGPNGDALETAQPTRVLFIIESSASHWDSNAGFVYDKCKHRTKGACLRCRFAWLWHLWRNGNRVWYLP